MQPNYRLFQCACCLAQVAICSFCDFGQRYCPEGCSRETLRASWRKASRRYQATPQGRHHHAARQARYRARQSASAGALVCASEGVETAPAQKVTHKGSLPASPHRTLRRTSVARRGQRGEGLTVVLCSFCGEACEPYARRDFLRRRR